MAISSAAFFLIYFAFAIVPSWMDAKKQKQRNESLTSVDEKKDKILLLNDSNTTQ
jgi:hypothetical protein